MSALPICEKLRRFASTGRERRSNVAINSYHAKTFDETAATIEALYEALLLVSRNSGKLYNDEWQFVESTLAKARGKP